MSRNMPPVVARALMSRALDQDWEYIEMPREQLKRIAQRALDQAEIRKGLETGELMITSTGLSVQRFTKIGSKFVPQKDPVEIEFDEGHGHAVKKGETELIDAGFPVESIWHSEVIPIYASGPRNRHFSVHLPRRMQTEVVFPWCGTTAHRNDMSDVLIFDSDEWGGLYPDEDTIILFTPKRCVVETPDFQESTSEEI